MLIKPSERRYRAAALRHLAGDAPPSTFRSWIDRDGLALSDPPTAGGPTSFTLSDAFRLQTFVDLIQGFRCESAFAARVVAAAEDAVALAVACIDHQAVHGVQMSWQAWPVATIHRHAGGAVEVKPRGQRTIADLYGHTAIVIDMESVARRAFLAVERHSTGECQDE